MATSAAKLAEVGMVPPLAKELLANLPATNPAVIAVTAITAPDATDLPTALTLANQTKARFNSLLAALKA